MFFLLNRTLKENVTKRYFLMDSVGLCQSFCRNKALPVIPVIANFINEDGSDNLKETIEANYKRVKQDILLLVESEKERIKADPALAHLNKE